MKIYDISLPITQGMMVYPNSPSPEITTKTTVKEHGVGSSLFTFGSHTGTHIDAPNHFLEDGKGIDTNDLQKCVGPCIVFDVTGINHLEIMPSDFDTTVVTAGSRILFKSENSFIDKTQFPQTFVSLSLESATVLVEKGAVLVGTDFLGIEKRKNPGHPVHTTLLQAGIVVVEGLDLSKIPAGEYELVCLPINVIGADGAPARVVLIEQ